MAKVTKKQILELIEELRQNQKHSEDAMRNCLGCQLVKRAEALTDKLKAEK